MERRKTGQVMVGKVGVGSSYPISIQSMLNTKNGDFEASVKEIEAFCRELEAIEGYLYAVVTHDEVDDIIFSSNRLIALCNEETKEQFFAELEVARQSLSLMHDAEIPYVENIL